MTAALDCRLESVRIYMFSHVLSFCILFHFFFLCRISCFFVTITAVTVSLICFHLQLNTTVLLLDFKAVIKLLYSLWAKHYVTTCLDSKLRTFIFTEAGEYVGFVSQLDQKLWFYLIIYLSGLFHFGFFVFFANFGALFDPISWSLEVQCKVWLLSDFVSLFV